MKEEGEGAVVAVLAAPGHAGPHSSDGGVVERPQLAERSVVSPEQRLVDVHEEVLADAQAQREGPETTVLDKAFTSC